VASLERGNASSVALGRIYLFDTAQHTKDSHEYGHQSKPQAFYTVLLPRLMVLLRNQQFVSLEDANLIEMYVHVS
jgi:hypothetical protein